MLLPASCLLRIAEPFHDVKAQPGDNLVELQAITSRAQRYALMRDGFHESRRQMQRYDSTPELTLIGNAYAFKFLPQDQV
jgi:hypothetical protein